MFSPVRFASFVPRRRLAAIHPWRQRLQVGPVIAQMHVLFVKSGNWLDVVDVKVHSSNLNGGGFVVRFNLSHQHLDDWLPRVESEIFQTSGAFASLVSEQRAANRLAQTGNDCRLWTTRFARF